jgi:hypothetical protein
MALFGGTLLLNLGCARPTAKTVRKAVEKAQLGPGYFEKYCIFSKDNVN